MAHCPHPTRPLLTRLRLDHAGIVLSALCVVHCLAGVALVVVLGAGGTVLGSALADPRIHEYGLALALLVGAFGLGTGYLRHRRAGLLGLGLAGLGLMAAGLAAPHGLAEAVLTIAGVALLASAHIRNLRIGH